MNFGRLACAFGRHSADHNNVRKAGGSHVCKCRNCNTAMESTAPNVWEVIPVRDAGLGRRSFG